MMSLELRALRREWICAGVTFLVVWVGLTIGAVYVFCKYVWPEGNWLSVVTLLLWLCYSLVGGAAGALGVGWVLSVWHHWLGYYLCPYCGRSEPRKGVCSCPEVQKVFEGTPKPLRRRSVWRHYRKRIPSIFLAYMAVALIALAVALTARRPAGEPVILSFLVLHAVLCLLLAIILEFSMDVLKWFGRGTRMRKRARIYIVMFALWALTMCSVMIVRSIRGD